MWSKLVSLFHSLILTYPVTFISARGASLADVHITSSSSFSNPSSLLSHSGSTGWARVRWPPGNEGWSGKYHAIILSHIIAWRKNKCCPYLIDSVISTLGSFRDAWVPRNHGPSWTACRSLCLLDYEETVALTSSWQLGGDTDMSADNNFLPLFIYQGLKGERGSPGTAGLTGESVRDCINTVLDACVGYIWAKTFLPFAGASW